MVKRHSQAIPQFKIKLLAYIEIKAEARMHGRRKLNRLIGSQVIEIRVISCVFVIRKAQDQVEVEKQIEAAGITVGVIIVIEVEPPVF